MTIQAKTAASHGRVNYFAVFLLLVFLTLSTLAVSFCRFNSELVNLLLAMLIASAKGGLVVAFFMHLKFESKLIYIVLFVPVCLSVALVIALIPDVVQTDPIRHAAGGSLHWFNPLTSIHQSLAGKPLPPRG